MKYLIYCTKGELLQCHWAKANALIGKPPSYILYGRKTKQKDFESPHTLNGKIVAEFEGNVEEIFERVSLNDSWFNESHFTETLNHKDLLEKSCLDRLNIDEYLEYPKNTTNGVGYAIHIKNLKVFDGPIKWCKANNNIIWDNQFFGIPPQNMKWIWFEEGRYCLISIRPEWVCKILNGEKTIEIRKKVLKGTL